MAAPPPAPPATAPRPRDILPQDYGAIIDGGSFGDYAAHPAIRNGYATVHALQQAYPFATDTASDMAGLMIQAAINDGHKRNLGETIPLPPGGFRDLPHGLVIPKNTGIQLRGSGYATALLSETCGTSPSLSILPQFNSFAAGGRPLVTDLALWGLNTPAINMHDTAGKPSKGTYKSGSRGLWCSGAAGQTFERIGIFNFDLPTDWEGGYWTGSTNGTTLKVVGLSEGATITRNMCFHGEGVPEGTQIVEFISGTGGDGTYRMSADIGVLTDVPMGGDGHNYIITFRDCRMMYGRKGMCINVACNDSFEKMNWENCNISGNDFNIFVNFTSSLSIGAGTTGAADAHAIGCSNDYASVQEITFLGGGSVGGGDLMSTLEISGGHMETNSAATGPGTRDTIDGHVIYHGVEFWENGPNTTGWVNPTDGAVIDVNVCKLPGYNFPDTSAACMPFVFKPVGPCHVSGHGNTCRIPFGAVLARTEWGDISAYENDNPAFLHCYFDQSLSLRHQRGRPILVAAPSTVTVPDDAEVNMIIGTAIPFVVAAGVPLTLVAGDDCALASYNARNVFTGPAALLLTKQGANAWMVTGDGGGRAWAS